MLAAGAALLVGAAPVAADASPGPGDGGAGPTEAGTEFRTATAFEPGQTATASASTGDYLYWVFPVAAGQVPTVEATVTLPSAADRHGSQRWRLDVYDGLRRRQACVNGMQARTVDRQQESAALRCTLRTVNAWAEPWANDPPAGAYYVRLTVTELPEEDLGLPVSAEVTASLRGAGGKRARGGELPEPLNPVLRSGVTAAPDAGRGDSEDGTSQPVAVAEPEDGWGQSWWSDRWVWTAAGGVLAALAGVGGYRLSRGRGAFRRPPTGA